PPSQLYTLSLHDALPISSSFSPSKYVRRPVDWKNSASSFRFTTPTTLPGNESSRRLRSSRGESAALLAERVPAGLSRGPSGNCRSEEHTSELQSPCNLVC